LAVEIISEAMFNEVNRSACRTNRQTPVVQEINDRKERRRKRGTNGGAGHGEDEVWVCSLHGEPPHPSHLERADRDLKKYSASRPRNLKIQSNGMELR
jgi:hypothetical protein